MSNKLRSIQRTKSNIPENVEELAQKARQQRANTCQAEINEVLAKHKCSLVAVVAMGQLVPVDSILRLPVQVVVSAR